MKSRPKSIEGVARELESDVWMQWALRRRDDDRVDRQFSYRCDKIIAQLRQADGAAVAADLTLRVCRLLDEWRVRRHGPYIASGYKSARGGQEGNVTTYGSAEARGRKYAEWQADIERRMKANPQLSCTAARHRTAKYFGVSFGVVKLRTTCPARPE
jgi:hypothetical protein